MVSDNELFALGLGLKSPWYLEDQRLEMDKQPHELHLRIGVERGSQFPCPICGKKAKAHDFRESTWRHLNFFQHHCYLTAPVPRVRCPEHGVKQSEVPWARKGSGFTLLFEQAALMLAREMPVASAARIMGITDKRLWRVVLHYVEQAMAELDLSTVEAIGLDETASKRGHNYITVFIDMQRRERPVLFAVPGKGKAAVAAFAQHLKAHGGECGRIAEVVCDMSGAFLSGVHEQFPEAEVTVDWFHIVQLFTRSVDDVRKAEARNTALPKHCRWAVLKGKEKTRTAKQQEALDELLDTGFDTATSWLIKEKLRWVREAKTVQAVRNRITRFIRFARELIGDSLALEPMAKALETLERHAERVIRRWTSSYTNARMEGFNSLFQAARARARGYSTNRTFIAMVYLIGAPIRLLVKST